MPDRLYDNIDILYMNLLWISIFGLIFLYFLSLVSSQLFNIHADRFYNYFHLTAGLLVAVLFFVIFNNFLISLILTMLVGGAWEIHEWLLWKYFYKKRLYQPKRKDTVHDLILDFLGAILALSLLTLIR